MPERLPPRAHRVCCSDPLALARFPLRFARDALFVSDCFRINNRNRLILGERALSQSSITRAITAYFRILRAAKYVSELGRVQACIFTKPVINGEVEATPA